MKQKQILFVLAAILGAGTSDPARADRGHREGYRHGAHGHRHFAPRHAHRPHYHSHWARPYWGPSYSYGPRGWWAPYPYAYAAVPYAYYEPPVYVERVYEPPIVVERVYERRREPAYVERSYAQATPPPPRPMEPARPAPPPAPRLERYTLSATELFEFDQATLRPRQPKLDKIAAAMKRHREIDNVRITGHADRLGSAAYNQKLSQRRADAVKAYLVKQGVAAGRLQAVGRGESQPVVQCDERDQKALIKCLEPNRRVEVEQITIEQRR